MKTAEYYSRISLIALIVEVASVALAFFTPDPYAIGFSVLVAASAVVAVWAVLKEKKVKSHSEETDA